MVFLYLNNPFVFPPKRQQYCLMYYDISHLIIINRPMIARTKLIVITKEPQPNRDTWKEIVEESISNEIKQEHVRQKLMIPQSRPTNAPIMNHVQLIFLHKFLEFNQYLATQTPQHIYQNITWILNISQHGFPFYSLYYYRN